MMRRYVQIDEYGNIVATVTSSQPRYEPWIEVLKTASTDTHYFENGVIRNYTEQQRSRKHKVPPFHSRWCNETMSWVSLVTVEEVRGDAKRRVNEGYAIAVMDLKGSYVQDEQETWSIQKEEAKAWVLDDKVETPFVDVLSAARGVDRIWLLEKIVEKYTEYDLKMAALLGNKQRLLDEIDLMDDLTLISEKDWEEAPITTEG